MHPTTSISDFDTGALPEKDVYKTSSSTILLTKTNISVLIDHRPGSHDEMKMDYRVTRLISHILSEIIRVLILSSLLPYTQNHLHKSKFLFFGLVKQINARNSRWDSCLVLKDCGFLLDKEFHSFFFCTIIVMIIHISSTTQLNTLLSHVIILP